jgi:fructose-bisphosphate aldolase class II
MLARLQDVLQQAQRGRYAVGAFNISDLEQAQAVVTAAEKLRAPVILNTSEKAIEYAGLHELAAMCLSLAKRAAVPVVLNLDHGRDVSVANDCISVGYSGIMFDGSRWAYEKNVALTRSVVLAGLRRNIGVEGELGQVKYPTELKKSADLVLTDPAEANQFVRATGVCAFAVAIGNSHVIPRDRLDFHLLKKIQAQVKVPLVLHGASGTAAASITRAIRLGVCKINIDTDLRIAFTKGVRTVLKKGKKVYDPREYLSVGREMMMQVVMKKIRLFGSARKGI